MTRRTDFDGRRGRFDLFIWMFYYYFVCGIASSLKYFYCNILYTTYGVCVWCVIFFVFLEVMGVHVMVHVKRFILDEEEFFGSPYSF